MKGESSSCTVDVIWTLVDSLCFLSFHLQFQNNNNYMNMAEANGALLAAGDVSIFYYVCTLKNSLLNMGKQTNVNMLAIQMQ